MYSESIGKTLADARRRLGRSIKEVEFDTKIRAKYVQALEDDEFSVLPADIYTQGFIKTYASYLGLEADPLIQQYKSQHTEPDYNDLVKVSSNMRVETKKKPAWFIPAVALGAVAALFVALIIWGAIAQSMSKGQKVIVQDIKTRKTVETVVAAETADNSRRISASTTIPATTTTTENKDAIPIDGSELAVKLTGLGDQGSWVTVTADGEKKYAGLIEPGVSKLFEADGSLEVRIGNIDDLEVMVNGKKIPSKKFKKGNGITIASFRLGN